MTQSTLNWEKRVAHFAESRAHVCQAVSDIVKKRKSDADYYRVKRNGADSFLGPTYVEIRLWIREHKRYEMENVGARCRELYSLGWMRKETEDSGRVHVFPCEAGGSGREHTT